MGRTIDLSTLLKVSLRAKIALGVALPILLVMSSVLVIHHRRAHQLLADQLQLTATQMSDMLLDSLRHAMLNDNHEMATEVLVDVGQMENVQQIQLINLEGQVRIDSLNQDVGQIRDTDHLGCQECHQYSPENRPRTTRLVTSSGTMRISTPIVNEPVCHDCHQAEQAHLGVLLIDLSFSGLEKRLADDLRTELLLSVIIALAIAVGVYLLLQRLVVDRVPVLDIPTAENRNGNFATRLPVPPKSGDELDRLAQTLNHMAEELERYAHVQDNLNRFRRQAIVDERKRIARELHDGMGQLLGYLNTKIITVRLVLKKGQIETADQHLGQLEEAVRSLSIDVYESIMGLKMVTGNGTKLAAQLKAFSHKFSQLSDVPVETTIAPPVDTLSLEAETELHLLRIAQEALTNVRKHAAATNVKINMHLDTDRLVLAINDNGRGFQADDIHSDHRPRYGLGTMQERADTIGAEFDLNSTPGAGTRIKVTLPFEEK